MNKVTDPLMGHGKDKAICPGCGVIGCTPAPFGVKEGQLPQGSGECDDELSRGCTKFPKQK